MEDELSKTLLSELKNYLLSYYGLKYTSKQEYNLFQRLRLAAKNIGYSNTIEFVQDIISCKLDLDQHKILANLLTIGETYFFRENKGFNYIKNVYLPNLIKERYGKNQQIRIWSAGCATGEEPYSIAILIHQLIPNITNWNISILATDINTDFIEKAKIGIYSKWSFRNSQDWLIKNYFNKIGNNHYEISPTIKKMVNYDFLNLVKTNYPSKIPNTTSIDIIFCKNVLIYFSNKSITDVTNKLYDALNPNGILLVSPVEMTNLISAKFNKTIYDGHTIYQKKKSSSPKNTTRLNYEKTNFTTTTNKDNTNGDTINSNKPTSLNSLVKKTERYPSFSTIFEKAKANPGELNEAKTTCKLAFDINKKKTPHIT